MLERYLLDEYGWPGTCILLAGIHMHNIPIMMLWLPLKQDNLTTDQMCITKTEDTPKCCGPLWTPFKKVIVSCRQCYTQCDNTFLFTFLCCLLIFLGHSMPYIFLPLRAIDNGCTPWQAAILLSIVGFTEIPGKLIIGIAGVSMINVVILFGSTALIGGLVSLLTGVCHLYEILAVLGAAYGFLLGKFCA